MAPENSHELGPLLSLLPLSPYGSSHDSKELLVPPHMPPGVCMLSVGSRQLKGFLSRESWSFSHILHSTQLVSLSSLCAPGQLLGRFSPGVLGSHGLQHDSCTWAWGIVQEPSPFPILIFVTDWQQRGKKNRANDI